MPCFVTCSHDRASQLKAKYSPWLLAGTVAAGALHLRQLGFHNIYNDINRYGRFFVKLLQIADPPATFGCNTFF